MGLIEYDWVATQPSMKPSEFVFEEFIKKGRDLVKFFKSEKCDIIIALTHMRNNNDQELANTIPEIDFILGGHDHCFYYHASKGGLAIKSGTDFRELTVNRVKVITKKIPDNIVEYKSSTINKSETLFETTIEKGTYTLIVETELIRVVESMKEDENIKKFVLSLEEKTDEKFKEIISHLLSPIDARFTEVRKHCLPISNFVADLVNVYMHTDCTIINSGSLRIDSIINEGELTFGILKRLFPGEYNIVRLHAKGSQIYKTLENGVSKYPALEGRYPIISGIIFSFDPNLKTPKRISAENIFINGEKLDVNKSYTLATREFLHQGYDGFDELPHCENIDKSIDLGTVFGICLSYCQLVKKLKSNYEDDMEEIVFGFDATKKGLKQLLKKTVSFKDGVPYLDINSESRINTI